MERIEKFQKTTVVNLFLLVALIFYGCDSAKETFGLRKTMPNTFDIAPNSKDLEVPPDFLIHPPKDGQSQPASTVLSTGGGSILSKEKISSTEAEKEVLEQVFSSSPKSPDPTKP